MERDAAISSRPLVIGIGNSFRGDDGVGPKLVRRLNQRPLDADFIEVSGDATSLVQAWQDRERVFAIDAAQMGERPGSFKRIDVAHEELQVPAKDVSSHGFGLAQAIELGRALNRLPARFIIFAIQGEAFGEGQTLSARVVAAMPHIESEILKELQALCLHEVH